MKVINRKPSVFDRYCLVLPSGYMMCDREWCCNRCEIADRIRSNKNDAPLFSWRDVEPQTPSGCRDFFNKPIVLKPEALARLNLEPVLINQIFIPIPSPGCDYRNPSGEIDGSLIADPRRSLTVSRCEVYGVPTFAAAKRFDEIYFFGLSRYLRKE